MRLIFKCILQTFFGDVASGTYCDGFRYVVFACASVVFREPPVCGIALACAFVSNFQMPPPLCVNV